MKILYKSMYSALLMGAIGLNAAAQQQLPNSGFEEAWVDCIPWTSDGNSAAVTQKIDNVTVTGQEPSGWRISDVIGVKLGSMLMGSTIVGFKADGYNSNTAVRLSNSPNATVPEQTVPGYMTLGKTWSTSVMGKENDGGSFDGIKFTDRPESIEFMYKHSTTTGEKATVVAYLWKGHWTQANVPGNIVAWGSPKTADMPDRDRCVLQMDMTGLKGGTVTPSDNPELIAVINQEFAGESEATAADTDSNDGWKKFSAKFDYKSDATPEMINVVLSAGNYFGGASAVKQGTELIVDNVKLVYSYSGYLNIKMSGASLVTDQEANIKIIPESTADKCTFILPDFNLESLGLKLGDIVVNNVTMSEKDGVKYYEGSVDGLILKPEGEDAEIEANVSLSGTTDNMKITVEWVMAPGQVIPIDVTFTKEPSINTGITDVNVDNSNAPVEFYNLQGIRVNGYNLTPGIYVRRQGSAVSKVLVK